MFVQVSPGLVVLGSLLLVLLSSVSLSVWATHSHLFLTLGVAMAGAGVASVFASGMVGGHKPGWSNALLLAVVGEGADGSDQ